ncbi:hypothetical protein HanRHA438_Chr04g0199931 [Helianthus annuus]|nr:hypothetical protein HanRHA438_Chr04g0199931 [Helianthus annuus]
MREGMPKLLGLRVRVRLRVWLRPTVAEIGGRWWWWCWMVVVVVVMGGFCLCCGCRASSFAVDSFRIILW